MGGAPLRRVEFGAMKAFLVPALMGVSAAKHIAWYVSYQVSGDSRV